MLVPQNIVLDDINITPEFVRTHIIQFDPTNQPAFVTLNGVFLCYPPLKALVVRLSMFPRFLNGKCIFGCVLSDA